MSIQTAISYDIVISGTVAGLLRVRRSSVDDLAVRLALGHASVTTTQLYLHADADEVVAATRGAWIDGLQPLS